MSSKSLALNTMYTHIPGSVCILEALIGVRDTDTVKIQTWLQ